MKTGKNSTTPAKNLSRPDREGFLVPDQEKQDLRQFGQHLRRERELRGISLEEVAQVTRINQRYLTAIEEGREEILPAVPFVKGFISAYAKHIGLNPEEALGFYDEVRENRAPEGKSAPPEPAPRKRGRRVLAWSLGAGLLLVLAGGILAYRISRRETAENVPALVTAPVQTAPPAAPSLTAPGPAPGGESVPAASAPPPTASAASPGEVGVNLLLQAADKSWVYAVIDEQNVKDFFLKPGERSELKARREIKLTLGNAGGVAVSFNGKKIENLGKSREVKRDILFTWDAVRGPEVRDPFTRSEEPPR